MRRDWLTLAFGLVLVGVVLGLSLRQNMTHPPQDVSQKGEAGPAVGAVPDSSARPAATSAAPDTKPKPRGAIPDRTAPERAPANPPTASAPTTGLAILQVQSDVPGASVFLDREFVGATPVTLRALTPGPRQLNVTATGHEGHSSTITLTEGPNRVNVEFLKVQLSAAVPVVHRHGMGSCQGTLTASPKGLSYDASNKTDAFALTFGDIDEFEVDYLKKNLRVRRREGKTWNFTNDNADVLFAFHRDVSKARDKLASTR